MLNFRHVVLDVNSTRKLNYAADIFTVQLQCWVHWVGGHLAVDLALRGHEFDSDRESRFDSRFSEHGCIVTRQVVHTLVFLLLCSIIRYQSMGGDAVKLARLP